MSGTAADRIVRASVFGAVLVAAVMLALVPTGIGRADELVSDPHDVASRQALAQLTLVQRAAQVITTSVPGTAITGRTRASLAALGPGGIILFAENYRSRVQLRRFTTQLQAAARGGAAAMPGALVSIDQEGGVVKRIADAPPTRSHPQLGAADRVVLTRSQGRDAARVLAALGVQLNLAPVADLDHGPRHVMRERSFGAQPALVARHVSAFIEGIHSGGGASAVKHFPGFGAASVNSDDALATISRTRAQFEADLVPFRAAIDDGSDAVMLSHGIYTRIDRLRPASTSPAMYRLLRRELGYDGIAITDSLHAAGFGAATGRSVADGCVLALGAGADIVLLTGSLADAVACRAKIVAAVRSGRLPQTRIDEAAVRVLRLKSRLGLLTTAAAV